MVDDPGKRAGLTPEYAEHQRQAALTCLAAAQQAVRLGQISTAQTKLQRVEAHLRNMAAEGGP